MAASGSSVAVTPIRYEYNLISQRSFAMFRQENIQCKFEAEEMAAKQNYESEKQLAWDNVKVSQCAGSEF